MTRIEKCKLALKKGLEYCPKTGIVFGVKGKPIKKKSNGYIALTIWFEGKRNYLYAHQFAWYSLHGETVDLIDHKNRIKTDNRECNLRSTTKQINALNVKSSGAYLDKNTGRYESLIMLNGKHIYLGKYDKKEQAELVHKNYKLKLISQCN